LAVQSIQTRLDQAQPIGLQLFQVLRTRIIRCEILPNTRLSEVGIAAEFDVSRQPVREAIIKLSEEGLLEVRPQRGTVVPRISVRVVEDARFVREAIEADIVKRAVKVFDKRMIDELDAQILRQREAQSVTEFVQMDDLFHRTFAEGIGRGNAWNVIEGLKAQLDRVRYLSLQHFPQAALIEQHRAVVDAIRESNTERAEAAMRKHLNNIVDDLPVIAAGHPEYFTE
jgi:DNA-binding GntR family transcriptional regulator